MNKNICVFCSSSDVVDDSYFLLAKNLAEKIAGQKNNIVYGGSNVGLMRIIAQSGKNAGAKVFGVIPQKIFDKGLACKILDNLIVTPDMHTRKAKLEQISDAFIALPGGFGTLEELAEIITLRQLEYHLKPIVILNLNGFYDNLISLFEIFYSEKFAKTEYKNVYFVATTVDEALNYISEYSPQGSVTKWFDTKF